MESTDLSWRKSSYSGNGGANCVEVADSTDAAYVRDSKRGKGSPVLAFSHEEWRRFIKQLKHAR